MAGRRRFHAAAGLALLIGIARGGSGVAHGDPLPGTATLALPGPLDEVMVAGIDRFLLDRTAAEKGARRATWERALADAAARDAFRADARARLRTILGVVDERVDDAGVFLRDAPGQRVELAATDEWTAVAVSFPVLEGVQAEGIALVPGGAPPRAWVVAVPDCDWTPEAFAGLVANDGPAGAASRLPRALVAAGCGVFVPVILDRTAEFSGNPRVRFTNQPHREYAYRPAFELGRHPLGYEIQKILAAVDRIEAAAAPEKPAPVGVCGVGEGGRLALLAAACDERIDAALVCGAFGPRETTWQEPIDRNVWRLLTTASDAEAAALVLPRALVMEAAVADAFTGPVPPAPGRGGGAAPGTIAPVPAGDFADETGQARAYAARLGAERRLTVVGDPAAPGPAGDPAGLRAFLAGVGIDAGGSALATPAALLDAGAVAAAARQRQRRQLDEISRHTQRLLEWSAAARARDWQEVIAAAQRRDRAAAGAALGPQRERIRAELIGRLPDPSMPLGVRSRQVLEDPAFTGWEVTVDVFTDVVAGGILLVPKGIPAGERRPAVVCQHGLEGVPMDTITGAGNAHAVYKGFAAELARRGHVTFAPQNPYRGGDRFRTLQRKANPLGLSLFSFIIPQHGRILDFLGTLPEVDPARIGFYGLSYGGKTALRVPPFEPRYRLSICSADYDEWVRKIAVDHAPFSYVFTGEYEIFEWNMGHLANYAELSWLIWPRPFMVERGHDDGVAPDEWVAWEYAKTRRHWVKLGNADDCAIEWFDGPHAINGVGTYEFLDRHLDPHGRLPRGK
jgi:dienelactone hydrolase